MVHRSASACFSPQRSPNMNGPEMSLMKELESDCLPLLDAGRLPDDNAGPMTTSFTADYRLGPVLDTGGASETARPSDNSLRCRLPLTKLRRILHKIKPMKRTDDGAPNSVVSPACNDSMTETERQLQDSVEVAEKDSVSKVILPNAATECDNVGDKCAIEHVDKTKSKTSILIADRVLCLYCDRSFATASLQSRHVQRVHRENPGRRSSGRTAHLQAQADFSGCGFCLENATARSTNLVELFAHMVDKHADKYFACRKCVTRFSTSESLNVHLSEVHGQSIDLKMALRKNYIENNVNAKSIKKAGSPLMQLAENDAIDFEQSISVSIVSKDMEGITDQKPSPRIDIRESNNSSQIKVSQKIQKMVLNNLKQEQDEPMLSRLGITQNRSPGSKKSSKLRKNDAKSQMNEKKVKAKVDVQEFFINKNMNSKNELFDSRFDKNFYENVTNNVCENLLYYLDGKINNLSEANPDLVNKSPALSKENRVRIHESNTNLTSISSFPTLLSSEQYGAVGPPNNPKLPRKKATKNSWKWKFDFVKKYKYYNENGKIVKKVKPTYLGTRDLSKLDMWTQLTMRNKFDLEDSKSKQNNKEEQIESDERNEKVRILNELNSILDKRLFPKLNLEQECSSHGIKQETECHIEKSELDVKFTRRKSCRINEICASLAKVTKSNISTTTIPNEHILDLDSNKYNGQHNDKSSTSKMCSDHSQTKVQGSSSICFNTETPSEIPFSDYLNLKPNIDQWQTPDASEFYLSGEWARPRCYICVGCGLKLNTLKELEDHKTSEHPHIFSTHYEIVGREMIDSEVHKFFHLPGAQNTAKLLTDVKQTSNVGKGLTEDTICTKCSKTLKWPELYRHMLECAGDYAWLLAKKKSRYRPFGSRSRRRKGRLRDCQVQHGRPNIVKKIRRNGKSSGPRTKPSDAETIQRMLANLPPKRLSRHVIALPRPRQPIKRQAQIKSKTVQQSKTVPGSRHLVHSRASRSRSFLQSGNHKSTWSELQRLKNTKSNKISEDLPNSNGAKRACREIIMKNKSDNKVNNLNNGSNSSAKRNALNKTTKKVSVKINKKESEILEVNKKIETHLEKDPKVVIKSKAKDISMAKAKTNKIPQAISSTYILNKPKIQQNNETKLNKTNLKKKCKGKQKPIDILNDNKSEKNNEKSISKTDTINKTKNLKINMRRGNQGLSNLPNVSSSPETVHNIKNDVQSHSTQKSNTSTALKNPTPSKLTSSDDLKSKNKKQDNRSVKRKLKMHKMKSQVNNTKTIIKKSNTSTHKELLTEATDITANNSKYTKEGRIDSTIEELGCDKDDQDSDSKSDDFPLAHIKNRYKIKMTNNHDTKKNITNFKTETLKSEIRSISKKSKAKLNSLKENITICAEVSVMSEELKSSKNSEERSRSKFITSEVDSMPTLEKIAPVLGNKTDDICPILSPIVDNLAKQTVSLPSKSNAVQNIAPLLESSMLNVIRDTISVQTEDDIRNEMDIKGLDETPSEYIEKNFALIAPTNQNLSDKVNDVQITIPIQLQFVDVVPSDTHVVSQVVPQPQSILSKTSQSPSPSKRRPKKLNDCIAMLTGKLQSKLSESSMDTFNVLQFFEQKRNDKTSDTINKLEQESVCLSNYVSNIQENSDTINKFETESDDIEICIESQTSSNVQESEHPVNLSMQSITENVSNVVSVSLQDNLQEIDNVEGASEKNLIKMIVLQKETVVEPNVMIIDNTTNTPTEMPNSPGFKMTKESAGINDPISTGKQRVLIESFSSLDKENIGFENDVCEITTETFKKVEDIRFGRPNNNQVSFQADKDVTNSTDASSIIEHEYKNPLELPSHHTEPDKPFSENFTYSNIADDTKSSILNQTETNSMHPNNSRKNRSEKRIISLDNGTDPGKPPISSKKTSARKSKLSVNLTNIENIEEDILLPNNKNNFEDSMGKISDSVTKTKYKKKSPFNDCSLTVNEQPNLPIINSHIDNINESVSLEPEGVSPSLDISKEECCKDLEAVDTLLLGKPANDQTEDLHNSNKETDSNKSEVLTSSSPINVPNILWNVKEKVYSNDEQSEKYDVTVDCHDSIQDVPLNNFNISEDLNESKCLANIESTGNSDSEEDLCLAAVAKSLQNKQNNESKRVLLNETCNDKGYFNSTEQEGNEILMDICQRKLLESSENSSINKNVPLRKSRKKRKCKKSVLLNPKKIKPVKEKTLNTARNNEINYCEICNKKFQRIESLSKHKMTFTHIAKLSEIEFINKSKIVNVNSADIISEGEGSMNCEINPSKGNEYDSDVETFQTNLNNCAGIETNVNISADVSENLNLDISNKNILSEAANDLDITNLEDKISNNSANTVPSLTTADELSELNDRKALSVEEALFFECCSLLKSSEASKNEILSEPTVFDSNSYLNIEKHNLQANNYANNLNDISNDLTNVISTNGSSQNIDLPKLQEDSCGSNLTAFLASVDQFISTPLVSQIENNAYSPISNDSNFSLSPNAEQLDKYNSFDAEFTMPSIRVENNFSPISEESDSDNLSSNICPKTISDVNLSTSYTKQSNSIMYISDTTQLEPANVYKSKYESYLEENMIIRSNSDSFSDMCDSCSPSINNIHEQAKQPNPESSEIIKPVESSSRPPSRAEQKLYKDNRSSGADLMCNEICTKEIVSSEPIEVDLLTSVLSTNPLSNKKIPTKGALKVFESLKVSIPTSEFNLQKVISSCTNSKLAAFVEIALHSEQTDKPFITDQTMDKIQKRDEQDTINSYVNCENEQGNIMQEPIDACNGIPGDKNALELIEVDKQTVASKYNSSSQKKHNFNRKHDTSNNKRKNLVLTFGNNLGFRIKKKRVCNKKKAKSSVKSKNRNINKHIIKDIYDFDDSQDNIDWSAEKVTSYASNKITLKCEIPNDTTDANNHTEDMQKGDVVEKPVIPSEDDDDFDYLSDHLTESSVESNEVIKPSIDSQGNPKRLIVGKIFRKNLKDKSDKPNLDELFDNLLSENIEEIKFNEIQSKPDSIENVKALENKQKKECQSTKENVVNYQFNSKELIQVDGNIKSDTGKSSTTSKSRKNRSKSVIEQELGMSFQQIKEIIGFAQRKSQRKCTTGKQNVLAENWSSDEDFETGLKKERNKLDKRVCKGNEQKDHLEKNDDKEMSQNSLSTENSCSQDIIEQNVPKTADENITVINSETNKLGHINNLNHQICEQIQGNTINGASSKIKRNSHRNIKNDSSSSYSEYEGTVRRSRKVKRRRKSFKLQTKNEYMNVKDLEVEQNNITNQDSHKSITDSNNLPAANDNVEALKHNVLVETLATAINVEEIGRTKKRSRQNPTDLDAQTAAILSLPRRKRVSTDMLYYWSSSSDDDQYAGMIEVKPIRDDVNLNEHPIQHGWIVGDSHKKLVTLLAHTKGKKTEDCLVKESNIKKNRQTL